MMRGTGRLTALALLAAVSVAAEEEHHMNMEETIIGNLESVAPTNGKFYTYTAHLGKPAMHEDFLDGKCPSR